MPHLADIGLLARVHPHVRHQFVLGIEGSRASVAAVPVTRKLLAALPELLVAGLDVLHQRLPVHELLAAAAPPAHGRPGLAEVLAGLLLDARVRGVAPGLGGGEEGGVRVRGGQ